MTPEAFLEKLPEIIEDLTSKGLQLPLFFTCIAADECTLTGSYGIDRRVVVNPSAQAALPRPLNLLLVDTTAKAQHVALAHANDIDEVKVTPPVLCSLSE
jgi:hypothetical protein